MTTSPPAQFKTCQICGRPVKAGQGVIANHGYQRPGNGWQTASCFGARRKPYETHRDALPDYIKMVDGYRSTQKIALAAWLKKPPEVITHIPYPRAVPVKIPRPADFKVPLKKEDRPTYSSGIPDRVYGWRFECTRAEYEACIKRATQEIIRAQVRYDKWPEWRKPL